MNTMRKWISSWGALIVPLLMILSTGLFGCSANGTSGAAANDESGEVLVSLTDAEGDFENYTVDVRSIKLTKQNGTEVEVMPLTARIDFAQYVDLEELVTTATIPSGVYTHATMVLDYSKADIQVEVAGLATPAAVQDGDGNAITTIEMKVKLDDQRRLIIAPGIPAHLTLDFDLKVSNQVDTLVSPPLVTVEPVLIADVNLEKPKIRRARGPLLRVNEEEQHFQIGLRPFHHRIDHRIDGEGDFGKLDVLTNDETIFEIDGVTAKGAEGLALLAEKAAFTPVIVFGKMNLRERLFRANEVFAGSSVPGGERDALRGTVIARSGDTLTVRGAILIRETGTVVLNSDVTVLLGENTKVTKQGEHRDESDPLSKNDISVGQALTVFGTVSGTLPDNLTVDATEGHVRMRFTTVTGTVMNAVSDSVSDSPEIVVDLQLINGRPVSLYDFSGTGSDPAAYVIATGRLSLGDLAVGEPLRLRGHVAGFAQAPPDFFATTIMDVSDVRALMIITWDPAADNPFIPAIDTGLTIDISEAGRHHVIRARVATELMTEPAPQVVPLADEGRYAIRQGHTTTIHLDFAVFVRDLNDRLDTDLGIKRLHARGRYPDADQTMKAKTITVALK